MQRSFLFPTWGGKRKNAGRKAVGPKGVSHASRAPLSFRHPVHVTLKVGRQIPNLRQELLFSSLRAAFAAGKERGGFRLVHFSVQRDHVHCLAEATNRVVLSRGVQALS